MSIYDDAQNRSGVTVWENFWIPFESVSAAHVIEPIFRELDTVFMGCDTCTGFIDPWDLVHDDFGDLRCRCCGSNNLEAEY